jgi:hypothetical protein
MNLIVIDRNGERFLVYGLQWNEDREIVNFQTLEDLNGTVGGNKERWREFTKYHVIKIEEECK